MQQLQLKVKKNVVGPKLLFVFSWLQQLLNLRPTLKQATIHLQTSISLGIISSLKEVFFKKRLMDIYCYVQNYSISNINLRQMCLSKYILPNQVSKLLRCLNLSEAIFVLFSKVVLYYIESRGETSNSNLTLTKFQDTLIHKFLKLKNIMPL